jgi:hypothetical protein
MVQGLAVHIYINTVYCFLKFVPLKAMKKIIPFWTFKIIWVHSPKMRNEPVKTYTENALDGSVHIQRLCGMR